MSISVSCFIAHVDSEKNALFWNSMNNFAGT